MSASERVVYGRSFRVTPIWLWIAQRASALLLGPLVLIHVWGVTWSHHPAVLGLLLLIIVVHGYSGLRRISPGGRVAGQTHAIATLWAGAVRLFVGLILVRFLGQGGCSNGSRYSSPTSLRRWDERRVGKNGVRRCKYR